MFSGDSNMFSSRTTLTDYLNNQEQIICEFCGQKYTDLVSKYTHQIYYCMGRDLSLEASLLRIRNNVKVTRLPSYTYASRQGRGASFSRKYPLYSHINDRPDSNKAGYFSNDIDDTKSEGATSASSFKLPVIVNFLFKV